MRRSPSSGARDTASTVAKLALSSSASEQGRPWELVRRQLLPHQVPCLTMCSLTSHQHHPSEALWHPHRQVAWFPASGGAAIRWHDRRALPHSRHLHARLDGRLPPVDPLVGSGTQFAHLCRLVQSGLHLFLVLHRLVLALLRLWLRTVRGADFTLSMTVDTYLMSAASGECPCSHPLCHIYR